jgi:cyclopropane fatty-acyl-phospholipid synthase-like methyltransferase
MFGAALMGFVQQSGARALPGSPAHARRSLRERLRRWWGGPCPGRHPFKERLGAWWNGVALPAPPPPEADESDDQSQEPILSDGSDDGRSQPAEQWTEERVNVLEAVFGGGALTPGGIPAMLKLVQPLGLDPSMSVLEFGAGIGGATRAIAEEFDTWVTGIEPSALLVGIADVRAHSTGMAKKAPVLHENLDAPEIRARYYNAIYSRDALYTVGKKDALIGTLVQGLRPKGQITFIDYVAVDDLALVSAEVKAWKEREPTSVHLWTAERYRQALVGQKLEVRTVEDVTDQVRHDIIAAWGNYLKTFNIKALGSTASAEVVVREAELWVSRFNTLSSGRLKAVRIYAMKK